RSRGRRASTESQAWSRRKISRRRLKCAASDCDCKEEAMLGWDSWKKGFDAWEDATAKYLEAWLRSPFVLGPSASMLTMLMKAKAMGDNAREQWWAQVGLPTKRDQERTLHLLNQLQSRVMDLEEKLEDARK